MAESAGRRPRRAAFRFRELGVAADHHQHVVEVVGDAAGELAQRFHFLGLAQGLLDKLPARDLALPLLDQPLFVAHAPQRQEAYGKQRHGGGDRKGAEQQQIEQPHPAQAREAQPVADIDRITSHPLDAVETLDAVHFRDIPEIEAPALIARMKPLAGDIFGDPVVAGGCRISTIPSARTSVIEFSSTEVMPR